MNKIVKPALTNALATMLYIMIIAYFFIYVISNPNQPDKKTIFIPMAMLMLLVFSVALVGSLIFGRPILWYLNGKKKEALSLIVYTLAIFFMLTIISFLILFSLIG